jgi:hypothetical protein
MPSFSGIFSFLEYNRFIRGTSDGMNELTTQLVKKYLFEVKREICQKKYQFIQRRKNVDFLKEYGLTLDDMLLVLLDLSPNDYISGPEEDRDTKQGAIWKFKYTLDEIQIYIKINYNPPNDINIISFHEEE